MRVLGTLAFLAKQLAWRVCLHDSVQAPIDGTLHGLLRAGHAGSLVVLGFLQPAGPVGPDGTGGLGAYPRDPLHRDVLYLAAA